MFLYLRHALSEANQYYNTTTSHEPFPYRDPDITERDGQAQAAEAGQFFRNWAARNGVTPARVVISPFLRTIHTATIFLSACGYRGEVILDPLIRERMGGSPSDMGTEKSRLLEHIRNHEVLLRDWDIDDTPLEEEVWFHTDIEDHSIFFERIDAIRSRYINRDDDPALATLAFSHAGVGMGLTGLDHIENCELIRIPAEGSAESLFIPQTGFHSEKPMTA